MNTIYLPFFRYVGVSVLAIAKWLMYEFHYKSVLPTFNSSSETNEKVKLLMTDTDSLTYHILDSAKDVYAKLRCMSWMDFSNYKSSTNYSEFYSAEKYLVPGYFKDEADGEYIIEFVGEINLYIYINLYNVLRNTSQGLQLQDV